MESFTICILTKYYYGAHNANKEICSAMELINILSENMKKLAG
jgi:hypothetical protein